MLEVSLFDEVHADASLGEQADDGLLALADDEHVVHTGGEGVALGVLDVGDVEGARVLLDVLEDTDSADVVATDNDELGAILELDQAFNFTSSEIELKGY